MQNENPAYSFSEVKEFVISDIFAKDGDDVAASLNVLLKVGTNPSEVTYIEDSVWRFKGEEVCEQELKLKMLDQIQGIEPNDFIQFVDTELGDIHITQNTDGETFNLTYSE